MSMTPLPQPVVDYDPVVGTLLDERYSVEGVHGRGGMAIVYAGTHRELRRSVAIKVLDGMWAKDPDAVALFLHEARVASSLSHPHIVSVSDLGRLPDGRPYLVMPMIAGSDLATLLLREGPQPPQRVANLLGGVAAALDLIHMKGLLHRDIKSENLMHVASDDGAESVLVLDFGIASARAPQSREEQGGWCGTPEFMPPEALAGDAPDQRGDVYSLATVAFELLAGCLPFDCENLSELIEAKTLGKPRSLTEASGDEFDVTLEAVLARGLARLPDDRYLSASEFIDDLGAAARVMPEIVRRRAGVAARSSRGRTLVGQGGAAGFARVLASVPATEPAAPVEPASVPARAETAVLGSMEPARAETAVLGSMEPELASSVPELASSVPEVAPSASEQANPAPVPASDEPVSEITKLAGEVVTAARRAAGPAPANTNRKATARFSPLAPLPTPTPAPAPRARDEHVRSLKSRLSARDRIVASARAHASVPPKAAHPALPPPPAPIGFDAIASRAGSQPPHGEHEHSSVFKRAPSPVPPELQKGEAAHATQPIKEEPDLSSVTTLRLERDAHKDASLVPDMSRYARDSVWNLPELDDSTRPPPARAMDDGERAHAAREGRSLRWLLYAALPPLVAAAGWLLVRTPPPQNAHPSAAVHAAASIAASSTPKMPPAIAAPALAPTLAPAPVAEVPPAPALEPATEPAIAEPSPSPPAARTAKGKARVARPSARPQPESSSPARALSPEPGSRRRRADSPVLTIRPSPGGEPAEASASTPRTVRDTPRAETLSRSANDAMLRGDSDSALAQFDRAIAADSSFAPAWRGKGLLLERNGRKREAASAFRQFLRLQPIGIASDAIRSRLDQLPQ